MAELNFRAVHVYGLTETYGPITVCAVAARTGTPSRRREQARLRARQGQGYPTADLVRVVDDDDATTCRATARRWARS